MDTQELSPSIYRYVLGLYKGEGKALGEIASEARTFELDMNAFIDTLEFKEGLER
ncbi:MAG: hypothetical protein IMF19_14265 [Proteobacteria bacterium]|nr:hypothetical protein [Pseudomonadota bacterium]